MPSPLALLQRFRPSGRSRRRVPAVVTALEVDGGTLRVVQATPRGDQVVVTRVAAQPLDLPAEADRSDAAGLGAAVGRALSALQIKASSVVMGVPRAQVILRNLILPALTDIRELASMVHFQISRDLPFRLDEAVVDFRVRGPVRTPGPSLDPINLEARVEGGAGKVEVLVA